MGFIPSSPTAVSVHLCEKCRLLILDDSALGGSQQLDQNGHPYIQFEDDHIWEAELDYSIEDVFPELPVLERSAVENDCGFCRFLLDAIKSSHVTEAIWGKFGTRTEQTIVITLTYWWNALDHGPPNTIPQSRLSILDATLTFEGEVQCNLYFSIGSDTGSESVSKWLGLPKPLATDLFDDDTIEWMRTRIHDCLTDCAHINIQPSFCPERLVDVTEGCVRLVLKDDVLRNQRGGSSSPSYAALSYCWGSKAFASHQLTSQPDTIQHRLRGISEEQMTPMLKDAVRLTRALGIPYLWIDALCILQKEVDNVDWQRQCVLMDRIYGCAEVTICALNANSCTEGFLTVPRPSCHIPFMSTINSEVYGSYRLGFLCFNTQPQLPGLPLFALDCADSRWATRGWTLQEFSLSTRALLFGKSAVHFSCPTRCERPGSQEHGGPATRVAHLWDSNVEPDSLRRNWLGICNDVSSRRGFAVATDRFPSMSGIANLFKTLFKAAERDYVAGHWKQDLVRSLIWTAQSPRRGQHRDLASHIHKLHSASSYVAPSWSWASSFTTVATGMSRELRDVRLESKIDAWTTLKHDNPYGAIDHAVLRIEGRTCPLPSDLVAAMRFNLPPGASMRRLSLHEQYIALCILDWEPCVTREPNSGLRMVLIGSAAYGSPEAQSYLFQTAEELFAEVRNSVNAADGHMDPANGNRLGYGMLLYPASHASGYYRVGLFFSVPRGLGGLTYFQDCETQVLDIF